jgi:hypothetical protein
MMGNETSKPQVDFEDYTKLKYQLTYELKSLAENVNQLTITVGKKFEATESRIAMIEELICKRPTKKATSESTESSLSPTIKWLLIIILGVAFLGALGAAIGINLLGYLDKVPTP